MNDRYSDTRRFTNHREWCEYLAGLNAGAATPLGALSSPHARCLGREHCVATPYRQTTVAESRKRNAAKLRSVADVGGRRSKLDQGGTPTSRYLAICDRIGERQERQVKDASLASVPQFLAPPL